MAHVTAVRFLVGWRDGLGGDDSLAGLELPTAGGSVAGLA